MARPKKNTSGTVPATATVTTDPETTKVIQEGAVEGQASTAENTSDANPATGQASVTPAAESGVQDGAGEGQTLPATDPEAEGVKTPAATETVGEAGEAGGETLPPVTKSSIENSIENAEREISIENTAPTPDAPQVNDPALTTLTVVVTGPFFGRWRIGRKFTPEPTTINRDELTDDEMIALVADPALNVTLVEAPY